MSWLMLTKTITTVPLISSVRVSRVHNVLPRFSQLFLAPLSVIVIQGTADIGKKLTEDELQKTIEFCTSKS